MVGIRVTASRVQSWDTGDKRIRVSASFGQVQYNDRTLPVRMSASFAQVQYNDRTLPPRVTAVYAQVWTSIGGGIEARGAVSGALAGKISVGRIATIDRLPVKEREINPYRATAPLSLERTDPESYDFLREQAEHLREQHNKTQAGDSSFPWEHLTKLGQVKLYTLGSLARFYHDNYGIVMARYVQYQSMKTGTWINGPAGRLKAAKSADWIVTNDYDKSGKDDVLGVIASFTLPANNDYGWLICNGANIAPLPSQDLLPQVKGAEICWTGFERVGTKVEGRVLARVIATTKDPDLPTGACFIDVQGISKESMVALVQPQITAVQVAANDLTDRVEAVEALTGANGLTASLAAINTKIAFLQVALTSEVTNRSREDGRLVALFNSTLLAYATLVDINSRLLTLTTAYQSADAALSVRIDGAYTAAAAALAAAAAIDLSGINDVLAIHTTQISELNLRIDSLTKPRFPVVVGLPPALVYLPDGTLVYTEL
jgi:hypothetical protein